jgi:Reverse transcriptase (RNA-dependent DNA polymerase)
VLRLLKSLYGLKQSPHEWYKDIDGKLRNLGFRQCEADENLYIPTFDNGCFLLLYVDDILLVGPIQGIINVKSLIMPLYKMRDLGESSMFLGIEIERFPDGRIKLSQFRYIERLLERFDMTSCNGVQLPMKQDLHAATSDEELLSPDEQKSYCGNQLSDFLSSLSISQLLLASFLCLSPRVFLIPSTIYESIL